MPPRTLGSGPLRQLGAGPGQMDSSQPLSTAGRRQMVTQMLSLISADDGDDDMWLTDQKLSLNVCG